MKVTNLNGCDIKASKVNLTSVYVQTIFQIAKHPDGSLRIRYKGTAINIPVTLDTRVCSPLNY